MKTSDLRGAIYLAAGLGLIVAIFAAFEFYTASLRSVCSINSFLSCGAVDRSGRTTTLGIPDYLWGVGGFVALLVVAAIAERRPRDVRFAALLAVFATAAVALSAYFLWVQLAQIHALCIVCATAEAFGAIVWGLSLVLVRRTARASREPLLPRDAPPATG